MRVFRTILGMLLLTIGLPALLAGGGLWALMQHRDPGGAFSGQLSSAPVPGYALVVPDIDRLLRDDAPFTRVGSTRLRLSAITLTGPAFVGLAPTADVQRYLAGVPHTRVNAVDLGTGPLPMTTGRVPGRVAPAGLPARQPFWTLSGDGQLSWTPGKLTGGPYSLVLMNPAAKPVNRLGAVAEVWPSWLNSSTWGLLTLGTLLIMISVIVLAWPGRRREVVYVVEPSQVPDLMQAIGAPLPLPPGPALPPGGRSGGAHRPRTLADSRPSRPPALPQFSWPPRTEPAPAGGALALAPAPTPVLDPPAGSRLPAGAQTPAPGRPLNLLGATPALSGLQPAPPPARRSERRHTPGPNDLPEFHATAVGAWVAATAPERARQTEARAAARLAEAARKSGATGKPGLTVKPGVALKPDGAVRPDGAGRPEVAGKSGGTGNPAPAQGGSRGGAPVAAPRKRGAGEQRSAAEEASGNTSKAESPAKVEKPVEVERPAKGSVPVEATQPVNDELPRIALHTGPAATDWTATGLTRLGPSRAAVAEQGKGETVPVQAKTAPAPPTEEPKPGDAEPKKADGPQRPIVPIPSRPAGQGDRTAKPEKTADVAGQKPESAPEPAGRKPIPPGRASMHAMESGRPAPGNPVPPAARAAEPVQPKDDQASVVTDERPGQPQRASMHAAELEGPARAAAAPTVPGQGKAASAAGASAVKTPVDTPVTAETPATAEPAAGTPAATEASGTAPVVARKAGRADNPLSRAQNRAAGKPVVPGAARPQPATRRAPAAWIKAAETMAARAARTADQAGDTAKAIEAARAVEAAPTTATARAAQLADETAGKRVTEDADRAEKAAAERAPRPATEAVAKPATRPGPRVRPSGPRPAEPSAQVPPRKVRTTTEAAPPPSPQPAATEAVSMPTPRPAAATEAVSKPGPRPAAGKEPTPKPDAKPAATKGAVPKPAAPAKAATPGKGAPKASKPSAAARILSYREEAAELLSGSTERRRRRTVAGRPADRDRPDGDPPIT